jgi:hypothetical protein
MNGRELQDHPINFADINLNGVSTDMGARCGANFMVGIGTIREQLVSEFIKRVCQ